MDSGKGRQPPTASRVRCDNLSQVPQAPPGHLLGLDRDGADRQWPFHTADRKNRVVQSESNSETSSRDCLRSYFRKVAKEIEIAFASHVRNPEIDNF